MSIPLWSFGHGLAKWKNDEKQLFLFTTELHLKQTKQLEMDLLNVYNVY